MGRARATRTTHTSDNHRIRGNTPMSGPIILGKPKRSVLGGIGAALLQIKIAHKLTLDEMAEAIGRSDEMLAQYISGEAEMGVTAWLRATEAWPELAERVTYQLDEAEKAFRAKQRSLRLDAPMPEEKAA